MLTVKNSGNPICGGVNHGGGFSNYVAHDMFPLARVDWLSEKFCKLLTKVVAHGIVGHQKKLSPISAFQ